MRFMQQLPYLLAALMPLRLRNDMSDSMYLAVCQHLSHTTQLLIVNHKVQSMQMCCPLCALNPCVALQGPTQKRGRPASNANSTQISVASSVSSSAPGLVCVDKRTPVLTVPCLCKLLHTLEENNSDTAASQVIGSNPFVWSFVS